MARLAVVDEARADSLYADLDRGLGARGEMQIGHNTRLVRLALPGRDAIAVRLYGADVVTVWPDGTVEVTTCGYPTVTTLTRINSVVRKLGYNAYRRLGRVLLAHNVAGQRQSMPLEGAVLHA